MPVIVKLPSGGITKCKQISNLQAKVGAAATGYVKLTWTNPSDPKFKGLEIFYKEGSEPTQHGDGTKCYDSSDGLVATTKEITGLLDGRTYYFRAFAYTYKNATRIYTELKDGAIASAIPQQLKGKITITSSQTWTVPEGVESIDVFLVGAGGGAATESWNQSGGGGGGYTKTIKNISVIPNSQHSVVIGSGVMGGQGGSTKFDNYVADGGKIKPIGLTNRGGDGGSAGGACDVGGYPENGASNGESTKMSKGQGSTTREFEDEYNGTQYAGGGGGAAYSNDKSPGAGGAGGGGRGGRGAAKIRGVDGAFGTGGGGGGDCLTGTSDYNTKGGSGVCIIRWGY